MASIKEVALKTIDLEARAVAGLAPYINDDFEKAVNAIFSGKGRVVVSGIGKSAIIAHKIVATFNSTGTPPYLCMPPTPSMATWVWSSKTMW